MAYQLNTRAREVLNSLVRDGKYTDKPWTFTADDANALLGADRNWTEYALWFLGTLSGTPDPSSSANVTPTKDWYAYCYGKGGLVYLDALKSIIALAKQQGDGGISDAAAAALAIAQQQIADQAKASACDHDFQFSAVPVELQAAADGQPKGPPTFDADVYTGNPMQLKGFQYPVVVDLTGVDFTQNDRPVLKDHDPTKPLGHTTSNSVEGTTLKSRGIISGFGPHVDEVVNASKNKFPWQVSMGAKVLKNQFVPEGETAQANGRMWPGPINIARRTSLREISFLALGADDDTSARIAATAAKESPMKFKAWMKAHGFKAEDLDAAALKSVKAAFKAQNPDSDPDDESDDEGDDKDKKTAKSAATAVDIAAAAATGGTVVMTVEDTTKQIRAAYAAESKRVGKVNKLAIGHPDIAAKAIEEGWDENRVELEVLRASRPNPNTPNGSFGINTGAGSGLTSDIVAAACAVSGGISEEIAFEGLNEQAKNIAVSKNVRRNASSIFGLCSIIAAAHGLHLHASRMDDEVIRAMFQIDQRQALDIRADGGAGGFATMSLSGITQNVLNKSMLQQFAAVDSVVEKIAWQRDTNDFKPFASYRLTAAGTMEPVGPTGELKEMTLQDETYSNQVATKGCIVNIPRPIWINDDMGALAQVPTLIGRQAANTREKAAFALYLSLKNLVAPGASPGQAANAFNFISVGANNYLTGASSALSIAAVTLAVQKFLEQTDANGDPINVMPDRLLLPPALRTTGLELFKGTTQIATALGATNAKATAPSVNVHASTYDPITSPYLANRGGKGLSGSSDTAWSLLPDPSSGFAPIQIGYLRGQRVPTIERGESNFNTLGMAMRAFYDFGVAAHDYRCVVWSDGQ